MLTNSFKLNTEQQLNEDYLARINQFWKKKVQESTFLGSNDKKIYTACLKSGNRKAIVISPGRTESSLKYKEVAFDLSQQGYDLFIIDHRGQGFSQRLGGDKHRGHVERFQYYVDDLNQYISSLNLLKNYQHCFIMSHSMGSAITALYLQQFSHPFQAAVFFSPMFSINLGMPVSIAKLIAASYSGVCRLISKKPCYIFGGKGYTKQRFNDNESTSSAVRFSLSEKSIEDNPEIQLGSPTLHWVKEGISASQKAISGAQRLRIPILILQAGADTVVSEQGQQQFFNNLVFNEANQLITIPGAKHEILLEQDKYRIPALSRALEFILSVELQTPISSK